MEKMQPKTTTAEALLGLLSLGPANGYELRLRIDGSIGNFWRESFGQIYPTLTRLEQQGLVTSVAQRKAGAKVYSLTEAGREHLQGWLEVSPRPRVPRHELLLKMFFGASTAATTLRAHILETRARFAEDLERYDSYGAMITQAHHGDPNLPFWLITLNYGKQEARMIVAWCDETLDGLDERTGPARRREPATGQGDKASAR